MPGMIKTFYFPPPAGIRREGSMDYRDIPSRVGTQKIDYVPPAGILGGTTRVDSAIEMQRLKDVAWKK